MILPQQTSTALSKTNTSKVEQPGLIQPNKSEYYVTYATLVSLKNVFDGTNAWGKMGEQGITLLCPKNPLI